MEKKHAKTPKEKRRNMEKRKEKSRDAARTRRGKETEIFTDLSSLLPLPAAKVAHLDKASVIRVAISYLKVRTVIHSMPIKQERQIEIEGCNMDSLFVDSLEGFLLVATTDGDIMFISDSVNRYLGLQQVEILGQSIFELSHPCDHAEIKEMLSPKDVDVQKSFFLRMKWNPKGRSVNVNKSTQYKVIHYTGRVVRTEFAHLKEEINNNKSSTSKTSNGSIPVMNNAPAFHFVGIGEAIWHPANIEVPLGRNTFLSKHSLDMKYTYADERIVEFFGYDPDTLITKSIYDYHHAQDTNVIKNCFKNLFEKGQSQTERYRFLALGGGYAWVVTQSTLIYNNNQKPLSVVCVNFIVSEIENKNEIYSLCQLDTNVTCAPLTTSSESPIVASVNAAVAVASPAALSPVADNAAAAVAPTDYIYDSPQHLIEKLDLNAVASASNTSRYARPQPSAVISNAAAKSRYATLSPATDSQRSSRQSAKKKTPKSKHLTPLPALNLEELLGQSSPPRSGCATESDSAYSSSADASPQQTLGEWLMNDDCEVSPSLYDLTDTDAEPIELSIAESQIKIENIKLNETPGNDTQVLNEVSEIPKPATVNVFVPFTEEMNKGFLGFAEDDTGLTMLKEDPEDLTHLAPTAGDVCVPLDDDHIDYVLPDMLEDIMFSDCNLLSSDTDKDLESSPNSFFSYRDDLEPSSRPLSPILTQTEDCSIPSFCSDDSSLHENSVTHFLDFGLINATDDIDDLSGKSTYIPLTLDQDPLLPFVTNDFMWGSSSGESSTWSSVPSSPTSNCSLSPRLDHTSSLAKLLKAEPICNYDGGGDDQRVSLNGHANVSANTTKHAANFGHNVNSLADRNYSNVSNFKTVAYHRNANAITEIKRRTNSTVRKEISNNRVDDRRKNAAHVTVGSKRPLSENSWGRGANSCKRSKQTSRTIIVHGASAGAGNGLANGAGVGGTRRIQESAAMAEATAATAKQTNSVLMNLLVSGCDLNAGYDEDFKESNTKRATNAYSTTTTTNKNLTPRINNYQAKKNAGIVNPSNSKCWSTFRKKPGTLFNSENSHIPSLMDLTEQDYAVNAPSAGELLQGSDLLKALECTSIKI